jgi:hypothetical protein
MNSTEMMTALCRQLEGELADAEARAKTLRYRLAEIRKLLDAPSATAPTAPFPAKTIGQAVEETLQGYLPGQTFTKSGLAAQLRVRHPKLDFRLKSLWKPLRGLMDRKLVELVRQGGGPDSALYTKV